MCPLRLAKSWPVKEKGLEPHSPLTIGGEWHLQEMQMAALLDMGLQCHNVIGLRLGLAYVLQCVCVVLAGTEPIGHHCTLHAFMCGIACTACIACAVPASPTECLAVTLSASLWSQHDEHSHSRLGLSFSLWGWRGPRMAPSKEECEAPSRVCVVAEWWWGESPPPPMSMHFNLISTEGSRTCKSWSQLHELASA